MITLPKLKIFNRFGGDPDHWTRSATAAQKTQISDDDWGDIETAIQDIILLKRGLTSKEYADELRTRLEKKCPDARVLEKPEQMASKKMSP